MNVNVMYKAAKPAKLIGREVHFVEGRTGNPRSGENSFVRLKNGNILNMYSEFYGGDDWSDHGISRISGFISEDEGETWGESFPIFEVSEGYTDLMCACALRLSDGDLAALYLARIENSKCTQMFFARSKDEGKTSVESRLDSQGEPPLEMYAELSGYHSRHILGCICRPVKSIHISCSGVIWHYIIVPVPSKISVGKIVRIQDRVSAPSESYLVSVWKFFLECLVPLCSPVLSQGHGSNEQCQCCQ